MPDTITGTITDALTGVDPATVTFAVTDKYGQVQPAGTVTLGADGRFSFVIALEASRLGANRDGRRYTVAVSAADAVGHHTRRRSSSWCHTIRASERGKEDGAGRAAGAITCSRELLR